ncbi:hypothetical protein COP2_008834 [Malus domestica]
MKQAAKASRASSTPAAVTSPPPGTASSGRSREEGNPLSQIHCLSKPNSLRLLLNFKVLNLQKHQAEDCTRSEGQ